MSIEEILNEASNIGLDERIYKNLLIRYINLLISNSNENKNYYYIIKFANLILKRDEELNYSTKTAITNTKFEKQALIDLKKQIRKSNHNRLDHNMNDIVELINLIEKMHDVRNYTLKLGTDVTQTYQASKEMNIKYTNYENNISNKIKKLKK